MFSLICARINDWINNREAGDLRRYRGYYDVIVMNATIQQRMNQEGRYVTQLKTKRWKRETRKRLVQYINHICQVACSNSRTALNRPVDMPNNQ